MAKNGVLKAKGQLHITDVLSKMARSKRAQHKVVKGTHTFREIIAWRRRYVSTDPNLRKFVIEACPEHMVTL
jgi:hypothetical protein